MTDDKGNSVSGASVVVSGTTIGVLSDMDGRYALTVPEGCEISVSFIGYATQKFRVGAASVYNVVIKEEASDIDAVMVVGYGTQKKSTLIGAVTQTGNKELQRTGGVTNLAQTLTGNLPGLTTIQSQGQPGANDPTILIRGRSSWNSSAPYILVDGVERRMNDIDVNEVQSISVLKDASATAVYGVKGANGVILITTKRGEIGKPVVTVSANTTFKVPSLLVDKLDAYDAITVKDAAIEKESVINPTSWNDYVPYEVRNRYRDHTGLRYPEAYPNIDWQKLLVRDYAMDYRANLSVSGGNKVVKYFTSASYLYEGDILKSNTKFYGKDWNPGYNNSRFNFRSNVDINVTKTTTLAVNLAAIYTERQQPATNNSNFNGQILNALYVTPSNIYMPRYSNGLWGYSPMAAGGSYYNPLQFLTTMAYEKVRNTNVVSDFVLTQKLDFITPGLSLMGKFSFDNVFSSLQTYNPGYRLNGFYINPDIEDASYLPDFNPDDYMVTQELSTIPYYDTPLSPWKLGDESNNKNATSRRIYYQVQINYARAFGKHNVTGTGVFTREQYATGSDFMRYREDWIFRGTYDYDSRYLVEVNGAYNGSEQFGPGYRFDFFPSVGVGWAISNESFLKNQTWLDLLKLRYSTGLVGDDNVSSRWLYMSQYQTNNAITGMNDIFYNRSPYTLYQQSAIGNPDIHWEKARKTNYGVDFSVLNSLVTLSVDYFTELRSDIIILGANRQLPIYYSFYVPAANVGEVEKKGYEIVLGLRKQIGLNWNVWANFNMTHAKDKVLFKEEPRLLAANLMAEGYSLGQIKAPISDGFMKNWDEIYASPVYATNDASKLPGDFRVIDFNADGNYDATKDIAPYGYSDIPQNTYSATLGFDFKGFSLMLQFYGVNNVTRNVTKNSFDQGFDLAYSHALDYWSLDNPTGESFLPRWKAAGNMPANYYYVDGSYIRLKNAELSYTFDKRMLRKLGLSSLRLYINGNNLLFWSKELPDDREIGNGSFYPNVKRFNIGIDLKF
ncbi:MAG TPA: TonB-dependent receptor [Candidatus Alistipes intestinipullorum]|nr:TonB-dependent receptor [Candidatus Alistipes intestinipullorum]